MEEKRPVDRLDEIRAKLEEVKALWDGLDDDRITQFEEIKWRDGFNVCMNALYFASGKPESIPYPDRMHRNQDWWKKLSEEEEIKLADRERQREIDAMNDLPF